MTISQIVPSSSGIAERPPCATCGTPMWLSRVEPHGADHHERVFECPICDLSMPAPA
jgi:hypothetical protein